jgi:hypothetical protein
MQSRFLNLALLATLSLTGAAGAQSPTDPPSTQHAILTATAKGVQVYVCQHPDAPQWIFQAPEATLFNAAGESIATHGAGPVWRSKDGSSVKGDVLQKSASPEAGAIPWLLLRAASIQGTGIMTKVEFIRRSDTHGGIAPTTGCDAQHLNAVARVP